MVIGFKNCKFHDFRYLNLKFHGDVAVGVLTQKGTVGGESQGYCRGVAVLPFLLSCCCCCLQRFVPSVQDFDKKLTEADAYLQILIDQLKETISDSTHLWRKGYASLYSSAVT
uniref:Uncharacterized protein n=1 Tax=Chelonoidis abingdonii TaxID=106734 RepID=A0A8C0GVE9_CHEAB